MPVETLRDLLCSGADRFGSRPALSRVSGDGLTYVDLRSVAAQAAADLTNLGVKPGDRVALLAENRPEWGVWYLAITAMGAAVIPILTDFHPAEVGRILEHSQPAAVIVSDKLRNLIGDWDAGAIIRMVDIAAPASADTPSANVAPAVKQATGPDPFDGPRDPDAVAAIIYTSGTTGNPKGVMLSHRNIVSNAAAAIEIPPLGPKDRLLSILPLAHSYECTIGFICPLMSGSSIFYLEGPPVLSRLMPALKEIRPTTMLAVPLIMEKLYRSRVAPIFEKLPAWVSAFGLTRRLLHRIAAAKVKRTFGGKIKFFGLGGAPLAADAERFLSEGGFPYAIGYGLTETAPLLAGANPRRIRFRSTGPALKGVELRIDPPGAETGEIQARGPNIMKGYYRNPEATAEAFTEDGWFKTGDLGTIDRRGYVYIRGRAKTMILGPSGENIYPEDIEALIDANPVVEESLVMQRGGELVARVRINVEELAGRLGTLAQSIDLEELHKQAATVLEDLRKQVNAGLNRFSRVGKMILQEEPLERTPTRKIKRFLYQVGAAKPPGTPA